MRRGMMTSAGLVALIVAFGPVSVASSAQKAKVSGPEKVFVTPSDTTSATHPGKILLTGTIADYGVVVSVNAKGKPTTHSVYKEFELKKGTILVDIAPLEKALTTAFSHAAFDMATCSVSVAASGAISIVSGTKAYSGITGSFMLSGNVAEIGPRTTSGACTTKTTTPALATYTEFTGSGTVSLP